MNLNYDTTLQPERSNIATCMTFVHLHRNKGNHLKIAIFQISHQNQVYSVSK